MQYLSILYASICVHLGARHSVADPERRGEESGDPMHPSD